MVVKIINFDSQNKTKGWSFSQVDIVSTTCGYRNCVLTHLEIVLTEKRTRVRTFE